MPDITDFEEDQPSLLSDVERLLRERFEKGESSTSRLPSTAAVSAGSERVDQLVLPDEMRPKMPLTKDKYLVRENPHLVQWEREVRKFLRNLSPDHAHRVAAVMVYEWATGIRLADLQEAGGSATRELRMLNKILRFYFGKSYMTYIAGRKVSNAYRVREGYYIRRHRPMTLTLWAEYQEGTLYP
jgi:hypothetical protein